MRLLTLTCLFISLLDIIISAGERVNVFSPGVDVGQSDPYAWEAAAALLEVTTSQSCCLILLTDAETSAFKDSKVTVFIFFIPFMVASVVGVIHKLSWEKWSWIVVTFSLPFWMCN